MKLSIELVPETCWYSNLRSILSKEDWDKLRKRTYELANYRCEICGGRGNRWPVECHEVWDYDDKYHIQKLVRLIALCPLCHGVKHIGLSKMRRHETEAIEHLEKVNGLTQEEANIYIVEVFKKWHERSLYDWSTDISWIENFGIKIEKEEV